VNLSSLSGMQLAAQMVDVLAVNVANVSAPDARAGQVVANAAPDGGVTPAVRLADGTGIDLPDQVAAMIQAQVIYAANGEMVQAQDDTQGRLFDVQA
jgi:flagellar hook protein FlgE